ncbi:DUF3325 domain-containing protein [Comamonas composti]|uniref:DUF3325 domain-containing protein n=1 Tax=Comamonas composti TaxID=408558 RepID=UPI0003F59B14|nr:DUF3325 domain-containing protein [Comamonas composti]
MTLLEIVACALALSLAGMLLLSQAMDRHCSQVLERAEPGLALRVVLRLLGTALMVLALWWCLQGWGPSVGSVAWLGWMSAAALGVAWLLAYAPRGGALLVTLAGLAALVWTGIRGFVV